MNFKSQSFICQVSKRANTPWGFTTKTSSRRPEEETTAEALPPPPPRRVKWSEERSEVIRCCFLGNEGCFAVKGQSGMQQVDRSIVWPQFGSGRHHRRYQVHRAIRHLQRPSVSARGFSQRLWAGFSLKSFKSILGLNPWPIKHKYVL